MISYLCSLVQFSPAAGRAGAAGRHRCVWGALAVFRPHWVCPAQGCLCFPVCTAQAPGCSIWSRPCVEWVPVFGSSTKARIRLRLRVVPSPASAVQAARGLGALSRVRRAFSLRGPSACCRSGACGLRLFRVGL